MTGQSRHQVTGYDRKTDLVAVEYPIDLALFKKIRKFVDIDPVDSAAVGSYPLNTSQVRSISNLLGRHLDTDSCEFFLEPVDG